MSIVGDFYFEYRNKAPRMEKLLFNCISYISELMENDSLDEKLFFWKNIIGMTDKEISELVEV